MPTEQTSPAQGPAQTPDFFEEELTGLRKRLGWTQAELGRFFGVSRVSASHWERRGVGETEPRKAACRLLRSILDHSSAPAGRVGEVLLPLRAVGTVTAAVHQSPCPGEGAIGEPAPPERIRRIRRRLGWSQAQLASFMGMTHSVPDAWERMEARLDEATRAAVLALDLTTDPSRETYPQPAGPLEGLPTKGIGAFYSACAELRLDRKE